MPHYKLPKDNKENHTPEVAGMDSYQKSITIPVNDEILEKMSTGDDVEIMLVGEVTATRDEKGEYENTSITIKISDVYAYPEGYMEEEDSKKGFKNGFNKANSHY